MGQGMMTMAFIISIGMLTMFFSDVEQNQHNPNRTPTSQHTGEGAQVQLTSNRQGHYVVTGQINRQAVEFLLDTGATDVVIPEAVARQLGLRAGQPYRASTANGTVTVYSTFIDELKIGDITLYNVRASINPAMRPPSILLGMSALKQIEFIQVGDSLTLRQSY